jgi:hypothetical protein
MSMIRYSVYGITTYTAQTDRANVRRHTRARRRHRKGSIECSMCGCEISDEAFYDFEGKCFNCHDDVELDETVILFL